MMATFPERNLNQTAVYWGSPTDDGYGGYTFADPVEIDCRWVSANELIIANNGEQIVTRAKVQVKQDLDIDGYLYLGELDDLSSSEEDDPTTVDGAYRIRKFDKTPTIGKPIRYFRRAWL